ncbi:MAG: nuclear transport factor 2 family protein [Candidatus Promineifilaceae bacterium]|jgi:hypothetical protein
MTRIVPSETCGNSPKNLFVQDLAIAFARHDIDFLLDNFSDDIRWHIVGDQELRGKDAVAEWLRSRQDSETAELVIEHAITHGRVGSVNGVTKCGQGGRNEFCNVYEFTSARATGVKAITSYVITIFPETSQVIFPETLAKKENINHGSRYNKKQGAENHPQLVV